VVSLTPLRLNLEDGVPVIHGTGVWAGLRNNLDVLEKEIASYNYWESRDDSSSVHLTA
jgi:hypothetical protein